MDKEQSRQMVAGNAASACKKCLQLAYRAVGRQKKARCDGKMRERERERERQRDREREREQSNKIPGNHGKSFHSGESCYLILQSLQEQGQALGHLRYQGITQVGDNLTPAKTCIQKTDK